jgi:molecular chaperone GrpE
MEKEENLNQEDTSIEPSEENNKSEDKTEKAEKISSTEEKKEISPEEKISELEDKLARTFAEMENQRRRFEKEKNDAFDYGGFAFAKKL